MGNVISGTSFLFMLQLLQSKPVSISRLRSLDAALTHFKPLLSAQLQTRVPAPRRALQLSGCFVFVCSRNESFFSADCDISVLPHPSPLPSLRENPVVSRMGRSGVCLKTNLNWFGVLSFFFLLTQHFD